MFRSPNSDHQIHLTTKPTIPIGLQLEKITAILGYIYCAFVALSSQVVAVELHIIKCYSPQL